MLADVFTNHAIAEKLKDDYYAVQFDAESIDTVYFDGQILRNEHGRKQTGKYHDIAKILAARNGDFAFPTTLLLQPRSEEHTSELQSRENLVCRLLLEKKNK